MQRKADGILCARTATDASREVLSGVRRSRTIDAQERSFCFELPQLKFTHRQAAFASRFFQSVSLRYQALHDFPLNLTLWQVVKSGHYLLV